jgi:hypothetical protein
LPSGDGVALLRREQKNPINCAAYTSLTVSREFRRWLICEAKAIAHPAYRWLQQGLAANRHVANPARRAKQLGSCRQQRHDVQPFAQKYLPFRKAEFMI